MSPLKSQARDESRATVLRCRAYLLKDSRCARARIMRTLKFARATLRAGINSESAEKLAGSLWWWRAITLRRRSATFKETRAREYPCGCDVSGRDGIARR